MDPNYIEIIIYGYTFYIDANRIRDLAFLDGRLVNISDTSLTMANNFNSYQYTNYPRITCNAMSPCQLRVDNSYSTLITVRYQLVDNRVNFNSLGSNGFNTIIIALLAIIVAIKLLFKK